MNTAKWVRQGIGVLGVALSAVGLASGIAQAAPAPLPANHWCPGQQWDPAWGTSYHWDWRSVPRLARSGSGGLGTVGTAAAMGAAAATSAGVGAPGAPDVEPHHRRVGFLQQRRVDAGLGGFAGRPGGVGRAFYGRRMFDSDTHNRRFTDRGMDCRLQERPCADDRRPLQQIVEFQHVKPGKGPAFVRTKLKNVLSGKVVDKTFNAGVKVETATVDRRDTTYLYHDGSDYIFMDGENYDQLPLSDSLAARRAVPAGEYAGPGRDARGGPAVPRAPGHGRTRGHPHRSRSAGRPVHRRHQARDAGDRRGDPGAVVHQHRRQAQSGFARRQLPRTRERLTGRTRATRHQGRHKARKRAVDLLFEAEARDRPRIVAERVPSWPPRTTRVAPVNPYTLPVLVDGVAEDLDRLLDATALPDYLKDWDAGLAARRGPRHPAGRGVGAVPCRRRAAGGRRRRGGRTGQVAVHRRFARLRQRRAGSGHAGDTADPGGCGGRPGWCVGPRTRREPWTADMTRLQLRAVVAAVLAATVVLARGRLRRLPAEHRRVGARDLSRWAWAPGCITRSNA